MFIDVHGHAYRKACPFPCRFPLPAELLKRYDELGVERGVLLPLVHPEVYLPQSNDDILEMAEQSAGRFIPFCNVDPRALTNSPDAPLGDLLRYYRDCGCRGIGEVLPNLQLIDPRVQNLLRHVQDVGFPLIFDMGEHLDRGYGLYDEPGLPQLEYCLCRFPQLIFVGHSPPFWAEIAKLRTSQDRRYPNYPVTEEGVVPRLFRQYPNLWADLSAGSGYGALQRDPAYAVKFLNEFQDRLMFGLDICVPDGPAPLVNFLIDLRDTRKISETVFQKIARENAIKLLKL